MIFTALVVLDFKRCFYEHVKQCKYLSVILYCQELQKNYGRCDTASKLIESKITESF